MTATQRIYGGPYRSADIRSRLSVFIKSANGVPPEEALAKADKGNMVIAPNKRLSKALIGSDEWLGITDAFPCWTGTMVGYEKPGKKLGRIIEYFFDDHALIPTHMFPARYVFPVPEEYRGEKDVILVAEHPNYALEIDGDTRIVRAAKVNLVERFPTENGWYFGDQEHDIPVGDKVNADHQSARRLWRINSRVGLAARDCGWGWFGNCSRDVDLSDAPPSVLGMVVEDSINTRMNETQSTCGSEPSDNTTESTEATNTGLLRRFLRVFDMARVRG